MFKNLIKTLVRGSGARLMGKDHLGNQYYESVSSKFPKGKRSIEPPESQAFSDYQMEKVPVLWESWLRHKRVDPPSPEELQAELDRIEVMNVRIEQWNEKERLALLAERGAAHLKLVAEEKQRASELGQNFQHASMFGVKKEIGEEAERKGDDYTPGEWKA